MTTARTEHHTRQLFRPTWQSVRIRYIYNDCHDNTVVPVLRCFLSPISDGCPRICRGFWHHSCPLPKLRRLASPALADRTYIRAPHAESTAHPELYARSLLCTLLLLLLLLHLLLLLLSVFLLLLFSLYLSLSIPPGINAFFAFLPHAHTLALSVSRSALSLSFHRVTHCENKQQTTKMHAPELLFNDELVVHVEYVEHAAAAASSQPLATRRKGHRCQRIVHIQQLFNHLE